MVGFYFIKYKTEIGYTDFYIISYPKVQKTNNLFVAVDAYGLIQYISINDEILATSYDLEHIL